jgi:hypothetical protein
LKTARVLDTEEGGFGLEYDNRRGSRNTMRLDAETYEGAVEEARSFLGIQHDGRDAEGEEWEIE